MSDQSIQIALVIAICLVIMFFVYWAGRKDGYEECYRDTEEDVKSRISDNQIFS